MLVSPNDYFEYLFDSAPVMMHSLDLDGRIIKVNRLWLERLGYERKDVLGRKSTDFLSEESQLIAIKDTLPLFWRVGSARSIGYEFVRYNGLIVNVLLDADLVSDSCGCTFTLAAVRDTNDDSQREQALAVLWILKTIWLQDSAERWSYLY